MTTKKNVFTKKSINPADYINSKTGETLDSEITSITSVNKISENLVLISSTEYVIVDSQALDYISKIVNNSDLANILKMTNMVQGVYNALYATRNIPHNTETLRVELDYSINKFRDFLKRLYKAGIISYLKSYIDGVDKTFILLNPSLARKSKFFDRECIKLFKDFDMQLESKS